MTSTSSLNQLPVELFREKEIFCEAMSYERWYKSISITKRNQLMDKYLPSNMSHHDKEQTMKLLLDNQLTRFESNPLDTSYMHLKLSRLAPDLAKTFDDVKLLRLKAQKLKEDEHQLNVWKEVLAKRHKVFKKAIVAPCLNASTSSAAGQLDTLSLKETTRRQKLATCKVDNSALSLKRVRVMKNVSERFKLELKMLRDGCSVSSEESDDSVGDLFGQENKSMAASRLKPHANLSLLKNSSKLSQLLNGSRLSEEKYSHLLKTHKRRRRNNIDHQLSDPLMDTDNISLHDVISRVTFQPVEEPSSSVQRSASSASSRSSTKGSSTTTNNRKRSGKKRVQTPTVLPVVVEETKPPVSISIPEEPEVVKKLPEIEPEIEMIVNGQLKKENDLDVFEFDDSPEPEQQQEIVNSRKPLALPSPAPTITMSSFSSLVAAPQSPLVTTLTSHVPSPLVVLPSLPPTPSPVVLPLTPEPSQPMMLLEIHPVSFFSLLRDIFNLHAPNDHKLTLHKLEELVKEKVKCFDSKVGWTHEMVQSAMNYLSGVLPPPEMVPLVDYKEKNQQWQWIGSARDSDEVLMGLCQEWNSEKDKNSSTSLMDPSQPVPPAICQTEWTVRPSNEDERRSYRDQEAIRYNNPHKAFTFKLHSYQSVVGPVKGCGTVTINANSSASPNKAREHSLLVSDRPPFVTLLSLVRDAAARLPNGEGTRADICELLKDSQYLLHTVSDQQVNGIVSGALDRLHYEKDPCVKYDVNRKVWIYLHRNRSEHEFERLHEMQVAAAKAKRTLGKSNRRGSGSMTKQPITPTITSKPPAVVQKILKQVPVVSATDQMPGSTNSTPSLIPALSVRRIAPPAVISPAPSIAIQTSNSIVTTSTVNDKTGVVGIGMQLKEILQHKRPIQPQPVKKKPPKAVKVIKKDESGAVSVEIATNHLTSSFTSNQIVANISTATLSLPSMSQIEHKTESVGCSLVSNTSSNSKEKVVKQIHQRHPNIKLAQTMKQGMSQIQPHKAQQTTAEQIQQILAAANSQVVNSGQTVQKMTFDKQLVNHVQPIAKQVQLTLAQNPVQAVTTTSMAGAHQISIPSSVFFGGRPASVVLGTESLMICLICTHKILLLYFDSWKIVYDGSY